MGKEKLLIECLDLHRLVERIHENKTIAFAKELVDRKKFTGLLIMGDINNGALDWTSYGGINRLNRFVCANEFLEFINSNHIFQI